MMNSFTHVPPGFRFHPTDEELVDYYLRKKVTSRRIDLDVIKDVDLYKIEPWDLQELCRIGREEQNEWYFFSHKDKKYPTGTRTNRATAAGFWKATGRDKAIYSKHDLIGMRKTLVFYKGRAPNGQKSDWIMHEYRLQSHPNGTPQEEGWVVCRVFKKRLTWTMKKESEHDWPIWYDDQVSFNAEMDSPMQQQSLQSGLTYDRYPLPCKEEPDLLHHPVHLRLLQTAKLLPAAPPPNPILAFGSVLQEHAYHYSRQQTPRLVYENQHSTNKCATYQEIQKETEGVTDWRVLDKFVASQLSHEEIGKENSFHHQEIPPENVSTASSSSLIDLWK